jgi:Protein of unknown function (DUF4236)
VSFYIRKGIKAGPFRFNLSKSGVGVSVGVPGFRVGTGPRGNYVFAGRDGLYYRASLGSHPRRQPTHQHYAAPTQHHPAAAPQYRPSDVVMEDVSGATALSLEPTGGGDVVEQLNAAATRMAWGWPVTIATLVIGLVSPPYSLILWALLAPLCGWVFLRDQAHRAVVLFYDVHDAPAVWFDSLVTKWAWVTRSQKLLRVVRMGQIQTTYQFKVNSGASSLFNSVPVSATSGGPRHLSTNVAIPSLVTRNSSLYFLPDRVLVQEGKRYSDIGYQHLRVSSSQGRVIENGGPVPRDAVQVGQTWRYVNVKGGPDRRFANNPMLPIMQYGFLDLTSSQGLNWELQISRADAAEPVASVLSTAPDLHK